jgi:ubiquinone/menaquinone biosynthesis C-methylase UbiE
MTHNDLRDGQYKDASNLAKRGNLHARYSTNPYGWFRWLFDQYDLPSNAKVLELGCGPAWQWQHNAERIPAGWDITLTDFSAGMIDEAQRNLADVSRPFAFRVMDAQHIEFADATFDAVFAHHMLYHVPDRAQALREVRRVLKLAGMLYAATNGAEHLRELHDLRHGFDPAAHLFGGIPNRQPDATEFNRETGRAQLEAVFVHVDWRSYTDALAVTEAEPLVDYMQSASQPLSAERYAEFLRYVQAELDGRGGVIPITKASGVFISRA